MNGRRTAGRLRSRRTGEKKIRTTVLFSPGLRDDLDELGKKGFFIDDVIELGVEKARSIAESREKFAHRRRALLAFKHQPKNGSGFLRPKFLAEPGKKRMVSDIYISKLEKVSRNRVQVFYYRFVGDKRPFMHECFVQDVDPIIMNHFAKR